MIAAFLVCSLPFTGLHGSHRLRRPNCGDFDVSHARKTAVISSVGGRGLYRGSVKKYRQNAASILDTAEAYIARSFESQFRRNMKHISSDSAGLDWQGLNIDRSRICALVAKDGESRQLRTRASPEVRFFQRRLPIAMACSLYEERLLQRFPAAAMTYSIARSEALGIRDAHVIPRSVLEAALTRFMRIRMPLNSLHANNSMVSGAKLSASDKRAPIFAQMYRHATRSVERLSFERQNQLHHGLSQCGESDYKEKLCLSCPGLASFLVSSP